MNRFQSIVDAIGGDFLVGLTSAPVHPGRWVLRGDKILLRDDRGREQEFTFEEGDELSETLVEFLNNLPALVAAARGIKDAKADH